MTTDNHDGMKHHLLDHLFTNKDGIHQDDLVQRVADSAGVSADEHRTTIIGWLNHLVGAGHVSRDGHDWVTMLSPDQRRQDLFLMMQRQNHLFE